MADLKKASDISIFKFFTGTLEDFIEYFDKQTEEEKQRLNELIIWIHESDSSKKQGYIRANGKYYTSDISEFESSLKEYIDSKFETIEGYVDGKIIDNLESAKNYTNTKFETIPSLVDSRIEISERKITSAYRSEDASLRSELTKKIGDAAQECNDYTDEKIAELTPIEIEYIEGL